MINQANEDIIQLIILNIYMESELNQKSRFQVYFTQ